MSKLQKLLTWKSARPNNDGSPPGLPCHKKLSPLHNLSSRPELVLPEGKSKRSGETCCSSKRPAQLTKPAAPHHPENPSRSEHTPRQNPQPDAYPQSVPLHLQRPIPSRPKAPAPSSAPGV